MVSLYLPSLVNMYTSIDSDALRPHLIFILPSLISPDPHIAGVRGVHTGVPEDRVGYSEMLSVGMVSCLSQDIDLNSWIMTFEQVTRRRQGIRCVQSGS